MFQEGPYPLKVFSRAALASPAAKNSVYQHQKFCSTVDWKTQTKITLHRLMFIHWISLVRKSFARVAASVVCLATNPKVHCAIPEGPQPWKKIWVWGFSNMVFWTLGYQVWILFFIGLDFLFKSMVVWYVKNYKIFEWKKHFSQGQIRNICKHIKDTIMFKSLNMS